MLVNFFYNIFLENFYATHFFWKYNIFAIYILNVHTQNTLTHVYVYVQVHG